MYNIYIYICIYIYIYIYNNICLYNKHDFVEVTKTILSEIPILNMVSL